MVRFPRIFLASLIPAMMSAACSAPGGKQDGETNTDAYVYNDGEFNRASPTFNREPVNIDSVTICYNKYGTNPAVVVNMATEECKKFNKKAEFVRQSLSVCPLFTPVAAIYNCTDGNK
jgi:hypothetical protein